MGWPEWVDDTGRVLLAQAWQRRVWLEAQATAAAVAKLFAKKEERITADEMWEMLGG